MRTDPHAHHPTVRRPHLLVASGALLLATLTLAPNIAMAAPQAFRFTDLDLRDPHTFVSFIGCRDFTDVLLGGSSFNGDIQSRIQDDTDHDGLLDQSWLLVWDDLVPDAPSDQLLFVSGRCTAPTAGTRCEAGFEWSPVVLSSDHSASGACLGTLAGSTHPYSPAVTLATGPCFATAPHDMSFALANGVVFNLRDAQIAATFVGDPPTSLANGLIRGFLRRTDADNTILPPSMALVGGQPLSQLFPGGDPAGPGNTNCAAYSDLDIGPGGEPGWWVYFAFTAAPVAYTGITVDVSPAPRRGASLQVSPNPAMSGAIIRLDGMQAGALDVAVHDLGGRRVRVLHSGESSAGARVFRWDGRDRNGSAAPAGVYFVRAVGPGQSQVCRFVVAR
ncbi:MAG: FlgD immunoglobulin-like domain containing protein [Candidatus Eisenbacteria bacterium]